MIIINIYYNKKVIKIMEQSRQYFTNLPKKINCYKILNELYTINENCIIYEGINTYINEKVLIRIYPKESIKRSLSQISLINNDIYLFKLLIHENILRLYEVIESKSFIFIITEYFQGQTISSFIKDNQSLPENAAILIFTELLNAMLYIHEMNICNLNINAENIYINDDLDIKIFDFKYGNYYINNEKTLNDIIGDPLYSCPEMHSKDFYFPELADVWSCGVLLYFLLTGKMPFQGKTPLLLDKVIIKGEYYIPENISDELNYLLKNILESDPNKRYKFNDIINSDYFKYNGYSNYFLINKGMNIIKYNYPINENAIYIFEQYGLDINIVIRNLNKNHFNSYTSLYKLIEKNCKGGYNNSNIINKKENEAYEIIQKYLSEYEHKKEINADVEKYLLASQKETLSNIKTIIEKSKSRSPKQKCKAQRQSVKVGKTNIGNAFILNTNNENKKKNSLQQSKINSPKKIINNMVKNGKDNIKKSNNNPIVKNIKSPKRKKKFVVSIDKQNKTDRRHHSIILTLLETEQEKKNPGFKSPVKTNNKLNYNNINKGGISHASTFKNKDFNFNPKFGENTKYTNNSNNSNNSNKTNLQKINPEINVKIIEEEPIYEETIKKESLKKSPIKKESLKKSPIKKESLKKSPIKKGSLNKSEIKKKIVNNYITNKISFEISSSYENLNTLSQNTYINDESLQNKLKNFLSNEMSKLSIPYKKTDYKTHFLSLENYNNCDKSSSSKKKSFNIKINYTKEDGERHLSSSNFHFNKNRFCSEMKRLKTYQKLDSPKKNKDTKNIYNLNYFPHVKSQKTNNPESSKNLYNYRFSCKSSKKGGSLLSQINQNILDSSRNLNNPSRFYKKYFNLLINNKNNKSIDNSTNKKSHRVLTLNCNCNAKSKDEKQRKSLKKSRKSFHFLKDV